MRGEDHQQLDVFSYVSLEDRIPQDHPFRPIRMAVANRDAGLNLTQTGWGAYLRVHRSEPAKPKVTGQSADFLNRLRWGKQCGQNWPVNFSHRKQSSGFRRLSADTVH